jgi:hypothetical protein
MEPGSLIMEPKMLLGIKERAERAAGRSGHLGEEDRRLTRDEAALGQARVRVGWAIQWPRMPSSPSG